MREVRTDDHLEEIRRIAREIVDEAKAWRAYAKRLEEEGDDLASTANLLCPSDTTEGWNDARRTSPERGDDAARDRCSCCRSCGATVPCAAAIAGNGCDGTCFCGLPEGRGEEQGR